MALWLSGRTKVPFRNIMNQPKQGLKYKKRFWHLLKLKSKIFQIICNLIRIRILYKSFRKLRLLNRWENQFQLRSSKFTRELVLPVTSSSGTSPVQALCIRRHKITDLWFLKIKWELQNKNKACHSASTAQSVLFWRPARLQGQLCLCYNRVVSEVIKKWQNILTTREF